MKSADLFAPERHGDADAEPGLVDFAVNVRGAPPQFLRTALAARLDDLAAYPAQADERRVREVVAAAHGRRPDEVLLLSGAAEGFELLTRLPVTHAGVVAPSFTEPARLLRAAGIVTTDVVCRPPDWTIDPSAIPADADLVVLGNPTNPTSVLHPRRTLDELRRPGRLLVVDEAFADLTLAGEALEPESLAGTAEDDVVVIRSVTKTFGLAGLRAGYLLAAPAVIEALTRTRRHWPVGTLALTALAACMGEHGRRYVAAQARIVARQRTQMLADLAGIGLTPLGHPAAPFVTVDVTAGLGVDGVDLKRHLRSRGLAVRSCANFTGLGPQHIRLAVREGDCVAQLVTAIVDACEEIGR